MALAFYMIILKMICEKMVCIVSNIVKTLRLLFLEMIRIQVELVSAGQEVVMTLDSEVTVSYAISRRLLSLLPLRLTAQTKEDGREPLPATT